MAVAACLGRSAALLLDFPAFGFLRACAIKITCIIFVAPVYKMFLLPFMQQRV